MTKRICVIGGRGYVGKAMVDLLKDHYEVSIKEIEDDWSSVDSSDLAIVCVPTDMKLNGTCDISIIESIMYQSTAPLYLIKSAIPPGTSEALSLKYNKKIVVSPEYVGEGKYTMPWWDGKPHPTDMKKHNFQIFGGDPKDTRLMVQIFGKVLGPYARYAQTDHKTAELTKYMENSFFAMKVTFCHEFSRIAEAFGVNYEELRELWLMDERVDRGSTAVFDGQLGYSGKCLPKDISAIYEAAKTKGFKSELLWQVMQTNKSQRKQNG